MKRYRSTRLSTDARLRKAGEKAAEEAQEVNAEAEIQTEMTEVQPSDEMVNSSVEE